MVSVEGYAWCCSSDPLDAAGKITLFGFSTPKSAGRRTVGHTPCQTQEFLPLTPPLPDLLWRSSENSSAVHLVLRQTDFLRRARVVAARICNSVTGHAPCVIISCLVSRFLTAGMFPQLVAAVHLRVSLPSIILSMAYAPHVDERNTHRARYQDDVIFGRMSTTPHEIALSAQGWFSTFCLVRFTTVRGIKIFGRSSGW